MRGGSKCGAGVVARKLPKTGGGGNVTSSFASHTTDARNIIQMSVPNCVQDLQEEYFRLKKIIKAVIPAWNKMIPPVLLKNFVSPMP